MFRIAGDNRFGTAAAVPLLLLCCDRCYRRNDGSSTDGSTRMTFYNNSVVSGGRLELMSPTESHRRVADGLTGADAIAAVGGRRSGKFRLVAQRH